MRVAIQDGIDAHDLSQAIYETLRAGMEAEARSRQAVHQARMELIRKSGGRPVPEPVTPQPGLFDEL